MKNYKVTALMTTELTAYVKAKNLSEAQIIARDMEGGEFIEIPQSGSDWQIYSVEESDWEIHSVNRIPMNKRSIHLLTDLRCRRVEKTGSYGDGGNLFLSVRPRASTGGVKKSWVYRYYRYGKDVRLGLGGYPAVSLSNAREITKNYNAMRAAEPPIDPREYKREKQQERKDNET